MLEDTLKSYKQLAQTVDWKKYNQNELVFKYIEHENDDLAEAFYAGIVCRYWGYTGRIYTQCNKHVSFEQCYDILIDAINYILKKRVWENPESTLYQDPAAPDKAFHVALRRQRGILLSNLSADKRKSNFNAMSIDGIHEEYNDAAEGLFNIADESSEYDLGVINLVDMIRDNEVIDIILLDKVCFCNWTSLNSIVLYARSLSTDDYKYYFDRYNIGEHKYDLALKQIHNLNTQTLLFRLKKLLHKVGKEYYND